MKEILFTKENGVGIIRFNRPKVYNCFTRTLAFETMEALDACAADDSIRCVYLTGEGKAFCAGQDLQEAISEGEPTLSTILIEHLGPLVNKIRGIEKPVVAAINGVAAGAGVSVALACDVTIATESASFIQAFTKIGLIPDSGATFFLPRLVGHQKASALMLLGDKVSATDADAMGMIYRAVPDTDFEAESMKIAQKLANMPTKALAYTKQLLQQSASNDFTGQLQLEHDLQVKAGETADYAEGVNAFLEKRKPKFIGK